MNEYNLDLLSEISKAVFAGMFFVPKSVCYCMVFAFVNVKFLRMDNAMNSVFQLGEMCAKSY